MTAEAPQGLQEAGQALWDRLTAEYQFDAREALVVAAAARQADDVARLEQLIAGEGVVTVGSAGQPRLSAAVTEVRQGRIALAKLLGELSIPVDEPAERTESAATRRARRAAEARWRGHGAASS
jgi:hypothetical protein